MFWKENPHLTILSILSSTAQLFHRSGNQGNVWRLATVDIGNRYLATVVIEGVRGTSFASDVAIDDVSFINCQPGMYALAWPPLTSQGSGVFSIITWGLYRLCFCISLFWS